MALLLFIRYFPRMISVSEAGYFSIISGIFLDIIFSIFFVLTFVYFFFFEINAKRITFVIEF